MTVSMKELYAVVDTLDARGFAGFFEPDGRMRFGNAPTLTGREEIASSIEQFFAGLQGLRHEILDVWEEDDVVIGEVEATYTRTDGSEVILPAVTIGRCNGDLLRDYRIYMDINPLFAPEPGV
ncbi:MAG TPA: nuclear transport factor 2 family protein [Actinomycetota bacterium]|nr:nuclear transport factor 2 family protein [Actinomycetota bacterium]